MLELDHHRPGHGDCSTGRNCDKAEDELMTLSLNVCRQRICLDQRVDSECSAASQQDHHHTLTTVAASLATADAILSDPSRDWSACKDARCLAREINNGHGVHHTSLQLQKAAGGKVLLTWDSPTLDDGTGEATGYTVWRRPLGSSDAFVQIGSTAGSTYLAAATGDWEYEVTFTIAP